MRSGIFTLLLFSIALLQACQKEIDESILDEIPVPDSLSIRYFTPDTVKEGMTVTIVGSGFDTAFINNSVKLNGTALSIVSVTDTSLVVSIPDEAVTGKISITVNGKTVFTEDDLVILGDIEPDTLAIHYFTPDTASTGMNITIVGAGFDATITSNLVMLNTVPLTIVSMSDTSLIVVIPEEAATGKISVTVNGETVVSEKDLVILQPNSNKWIRKADYPGARSEDPDQPQRFSLNGKGYILWYNKLWEYSPGSNSWTQKATLPSSRIINYGFCFTIADKAYIGLGESQPGGIGLDPHREVWEYNGTTNSWTQKKDFPGPARIVPFGFSIGVMGYIGAGVGVDTTTDGSWLEGDDISDTWKYDPATDNWTQIANFPGLRGNGVSGVSIGNNGYVIEGGINNPTAALESYPSIFVWQYDPATNSWHKKAKMPLDLNCSGGGVSFVINNKIYVGLGIWDSVMVNNQVERQNFWMYDPTADRWTNKEDIGGGFRLFGSGFSIGGKGYIGLGTGEIVDAIKQDFWEYTP